MGADEAASAAAEVARNATTSTNATWLTFLPPGSRDALLLPLRAVYQAEIFIIMLPRHIVRFVGLDSAVASLLDSIAEALGMGGGDARDDTATGAAVIAAIAAVDTGRINVGDAPAGAAAAGISGAGAVAGGSSRIGDLLSTLKTIGGAFSFITTRWALTCFMVALILNRVSVYASTRRPVTLKWYMTLMLRIIPIMLFMTQILTLLRAIRCQTSPEYSSIRYVQPGKHTALDFAGEGGLPYDLSSYLLQWENERASCNAAFTVRGTSIPYGSFSLLWPVFIRYCLSHIVDAFSAALQGRHLALETSMSTWEMSLAFSEAEFQIAGDFGLDLLGLAQPAAGGAAEGATVGDPSSSIHLLSKNRVLERLNVAPELLIIALLSCCNGLATNILDVLGKRGRYRLINTTFWALCFMGSMVWSLFKTYLNDNESGRLKYPISCTLGLVPHLLMLLGVLTCLLIYAVALILTAYSLPSSLPHPISFKERLSLAYENMQGSTQIRNTRLNMQDDFYAALAKIGYATLSAASEAVFLNEGNGVIVPKLTWLEEDRLVEFTASKERNNRLADPVHQPDDFYDFVVPSHPQKWESGYGREKKVDKALPSSRAINSAFGGVGVFRNPSRVYHGFMFFKAIFFLLARWSAFWLIKLLDRLKFPSHPRWLLRLAGYSQTDGQNKIERLPRLDFWILTDEGVLELPETDEFDVEKEMRKREMMTSEAWGESQEEELDNKLYNWWKVGGSWGNQDMSEDYCPTPQDWDTTSHISTSTTGEDDWETSDSDICPTPTQDNPFPSLLGHSDESLDLMSLARLLDPKDKESRHEARILSAHIRASHEGTIMTRRRFQQQMKSERGRILTTSKLSIGARKSGCPTPEEESELLENLILERRPGAGRGGLHQPSETPKSWSTGASGLGSDGPQCVICQASPRAIIAWPCRCLCVCEDCRISLAMNNFSSCVTCRQEVTGFVRLWVP